MTRLEIPEIEILREGEPIRGTLREGVYSITDKGKRLLEISQDLSDEEANEFLRVSSPQLEILRTLLKEGPKHPSDFPYDPRYSLKSMVGRGFLRSKSKGPHVNWMNCRDGLRQLLKENGPIPKTKAMKALEFSSRRINTLLMMFPEEFQSLTFVRSGRTRNRMFYDLVKASPVLTLKGDPRIVDFAASHIHLKVETQYDAKAVVHLLKWQIGYHQAREVVERLGYRYKDKLASSARAISASRSSVSYLQARDGKPI